MTCVLNERRPTAKSYSSWGAFFTMVFAFALVTSAYAQTFSSGSDGSDGALDFTGQNGEIEFIPSNFDPPLDPDGDGVFHFTTITIPFNTVLRIHGSANPNPVYFLAIGDVTINGFIDCSGNPGSDYAQQPKPPAIPGPGGYYGGSGAIGTIPGTRGAGPGGGMYSNPDNNGRGGGGGHAFEGGSNFIGIGDDYGNQFLIPLTGGSGGGGGSQSGNSGGSGGAGGGAILIASSTSISLASVITSGILVNGGYAGSGNCCTTYPGSGGGGAGGSIRLIAPTITGSATLNASGGGSSGNTSVGSVGRIRIDTFNNNFSGTFNGVLRVARLTPNTIFLPSTINSAVRVTSVNGIAVPDSPTGSLMMPDVAINSATPVTVGIAGSNIPLGTTVTLHLYNDIDGSQTVESTPLSGTLADSTATAMAIFSHGVSQVLVRATWTP